MDSSARKREPETGVELQTLWQRYLETRDPGIKAVLLARYAYLVRYTIGRMKISLVPTLDIDDLESVGAIGLIKAMERFDLSRNVKFETYAFRWVQGSVLDYVRQLDYLSRSGRERVTKFRLACAALKEKLGRMPSDDELKSAMGVDQKELNRIYFEMSCEEPVPLEQGGQNGDDASDGWADKFKDEKDLDALTELERAETGRLLKEAIQELPEKEKAIIAMYYYDDLTFRQIGDILGVSESRICQMHGKAVLEIQTGLQRKSVLTGFWTGSL